jgi:hypothetical protein
MEGFVWFGLGLHACLINDKREKEKKYLMTASIFVGSMYNHPLVCESSKHGTRMTRDQLRLCPRIECMEDMKDINST